MDPIRKRQLFWIGIAFVFFLLLQSFFNKANAPTVQPYSQFLAQIKNNEIESAQIRNDDIVAKTKAGEHVTSQRIPGSEGDALVQLMVDHSVEFSGFTSRPPWWREILVWMFPMGLFLLLYLGFNKRMGGKGGPLQFGKNSAKIYDRSKEHHATFKDIAGVDEAVAELHEIVEFLKTPEKFRSLGARIPRGVLLVGPPGTGKTLLARAIAGEAQVPFFSMSGSEFVEMFVGVGAARMRSLFEQAKERAPCIVFVDELDAIGKSRGGLGAMASNDEREQTLNQLLVEMDGFANDTGVIVIAATNRPEVLDPALIRAGRFDRQIMVDIPDLRGRIAILKIHARKLLLHSDVDIKVIARRTPGMSGADLANVVNEAALAAARESASQVEDRHFEEAIDRIQLGLKKHSQIMSPAERNQVAFHEGGHALVAESLENTDPVHKVTIVPRSIGALGVTLQLPTEDRYLITQKELLDRICVMMGGRAAEQLCCDSISTGAENDLERATETARQMVCRFGMSDLGAQTFGRSTASPFLANPLGSQAQRNYGEETAQNIDNAIHDLVENQRQRAYEILRKKKDALCRIADKLIEVETIDAEELKILVTGPE